MDLKHLEYFVTIVDEEGFTRAADTLFISQPALSQSIKTLENKVGIKLFERSTRHLIITDAGQVLYNRAKKIINDFHIMKTEIEELKYVGNSKIKLGLIDSVHGWLFRLLGDFNKSYPKIQIQFYNVTNKENIIKYLRNYEIHFCITSHFIEEEDIEFLPIYNERFVLLIHTENPLSKNNSLTLNDLKDERLIIGKKGTESRKNIIKAFEETGIDISPSITYESLGNDYGYKFVENNLGISFVPESYANGLTNKDIMVRYIPSKYLYWKISLVYLKKRYLSAVIKQIIQKLVSVKQKQ